MASDDDEMTNADGLRVAVGLVEPTATQMIRVMWLLSQLPKSGLVRLKG